MTEPLDYSAAADLFPSTHDSKSRISRYMRFETAALAVQFAIEELPAKYLSGTALEVGDERYEGAEIRELYLASAYPLPRTAR